jgi:prepilin-type N-terminal cleavage/methylation domain-containing protein
MNNNQRPVLSAQCSVNGKTGLRKRHFPAEHWILSTEHCSRGFTLIEVMVAVATFTIIIAALTALILSFYTLFAATEADTDASIAVRMLVHAAAADALAADGIAASHTFSGVTYTTGAHAAIFRIPTTNASSTLIANTYDYVAVVATGTAAYEITDAGSGSFRASGTHTLTTLLSSLDFTYSTGDPTAATSTTISATTTETVRTRTATAHLEETLHLRNHS